MAETSGDFTELRRSLARIKPLHIGVVAAILVITAGLHYLKSTSFIDIDRRDHKKVAIKFIEDNPTIANKIGKIKSVSMLGTGGGKTRYSSFSVRGEGKSGQVQITMTRNGKGLWYIKTATLTSGGADYTIPVTREDEQRSLKIFGQ